MKTAAKPLLFLLVFLSAPCFVSSPAFAWESDIHFDATYLMAKQLGFKEEVARYLAASSAWVDQSLLSGPYIFTKSRALYHFTSGPAISGGPLSIRRILRPAVRDNPLPDALFMQALKKGDINSASMLVHVIQDKEPHAGFPALVGHIPQGRWPDRYWIAPEKLENSVTQTFQALAALRRIVPPETLENPNLEIDPIAEAKKFLNDPDIRAIYTKNFLKDPEYVETGLKWFVDYLKKAKIIDKNLNYLNLLPPGVKIDGTRDIPDLLKEIITQGEFMKDSSGNYIFNKDVLLKKVFPEQRKLADVKIYYLEEARKRIVAEEWLKDAGQLLTPEQIQKEAERAGFMDIANRIVETIAEGNIPQAGKPFDMLEADPIRTKEMELRHGAWQRVMLKKYGVAVKFSPPKALRRQQFTIFFDKNHLPQVLSDAALAQPAEIEAEAVTLPGGARWDWFRKTILRNLTPMTKLKSQKFLNGAFDYQDKSTFEQLLESGKIKTYNENEFQLLIKRGAFRVDTVVPGFLRDALNSCQGFFQKLKK